MRRFYDLELETVTQRARLRVIEEHDSLPPMKAEKPYVDTTGEELEEARPMAKTGERVCYQPAARKAV